MEIYNLDNPAYLEAKGQAKVWKAYYKNAKLDNWSTNREEIMEVGFNQNSGYVYIALENGISIASAFGQSVEYIVTNMDNGCVSSESIEEYKLNLADQIYENTKTVFFPSTVGMD